MPILLFISIFTLLDFVVLFSVGSHIGLMTTLILVLLTGFIGLHLIRREGVSTLARARSRLQAGEIPSSELFTGAALIFGGALLMAPGFLSDALGLACLIPNARRLMGRAFTWFGLKASVYQPGQSQRSGAYTAEAPFGHDQQTHRESRAGSNEHRAGFDEREPTTLEGEFISRDDQRQR
ncbi:FxsA family protein [Halomonas sp. PAMB 3232]|uniref:FxsA family protein n=1 Tax=Halomonas sp. PAMB 3232 TaxID=3075221 RepID=UPI00289B3C07|nr:FxsA family protein [Halomonas sp. PAMB 3232]WNL37391.1 FxsA family protein [Halomonas sp. PAMB 3232]